MIRLCIDYILLIYINSKVNKNFLKLLNKICSIYSKVKAKCSKVCEFLSVIFDLLDKGKVNIYMKSYIN